jgi:phenylalanyl-tRNA synthetase alpha chain
MLHKLAGVKGPDGRPPAARYFSIDRVFRNESVDATHLAEFHQVEGVIADYNLSMGELLEVNILSSIRCLLSSLANGHSS